MTSKVLRNVRRKYHLWKKWKEYSDDATNIEYKKQVNKASKMVRIAKRDFEKKIAKNIKKDSKSFFKYVRSKTRVKSTIGPLTDDTGHSVNDDKGMGELLNSFFCIGVCK